MRPGQARPQLENKVHSPVTHSSFQPSNWIQLIAYTKVKPAVDGEVYFEPDVADSLERIGMQLSAQVGL